LKRSGVTVRWEISQREPSRGKQKVSALLAHVGHTYGLRGIVYARRQRAVVLELDADLAAGRHRIRKAYVHLRAGTIVAVVTQRMARAVADGVESKLRIEFDFNDPA